MTRSPWLDDTVAAQGGATGLSPAASSEAHPGAAPTASPGASTGISPDGLAGECAFSSRSPGGPGTETDAGAPCLVGGRYELCGLLGAGGMGTVYRARDTELDEPVALKVLRRGVVADGAALERFRREVKLARRVTHPSVARVFDIGEHDGERFLTMELVEGEPLSALIAREAPLSPARAVLLVVPICAGLEAAHEKGIVHRDLKPENVIVAKDGRVVLTDFGIARLSESASSAATIGAVVGTPAYMAPEQAEGAEEVDARADLYALGCTLFELLTGERPFTGPSALAVAAARLVKPPPDPRALRPELPAALAELVLACMARSPDARPSSARAVAEALAAMPLSSSVPPPRRPEREGAAIGASGVSGGKAKAVAVLPFRNASGPEDAYLAEGFADDLIDALSMTPGLRVCARGLVARFGPSADPREVGRELGVQVVVEGSLRRRGRGLELRARLVSVAEGFQLWAKRFELSEGDVFAVNDAAARAIADALTLDRRAPSRPALQDPRAAELYLRARHEYHGFWDAPVRRSVALFEQALELAPDDPMILSAYAMALSRLAFFTGESFDEAEAAGRKAASAAPMLGEARLAVGAALLQRGEITEATRELKAAVLLSPGLAEAKGRLGALVGEIGDEEPALRLLQAAVSLEPDQPMARRDLDRLLALLGRWDESEALRSWENTESPAAWVNGARMALWRKDRETAARMLKKGVPPHAFAKGAARVLRVLVSGGAPPEDDDVLEGAPDPDVIPKSAVRLRVFARQLRTEMLSFLGAPDLALESLRGAVDDGLVDVTWLRRCPLLEPLREAPGFGEALARVEARVAPALAAFRAPE